MRIRAFVAGAVGIVLGVALSSFGYAAPALATKGAVAKHDGKIRTWKPTLQKGIPALRLGRTEIDDGHRYVSGYQNVAADGATVRLQQTQPVLAPKDLESLAELAVQSADGKQIVEIGWIVSKVVNGDTVPHLFVFHWVDGKVTCFNGCGFVSTSDVKPGQRAQVGATGTYQIQHANGQWRLSYNGTQIGYFPDSLWNGRYTRAGLIQAFGEVQSNSLVTCTDMGNGTFGHADGSAQISGFALINGATPAALRMNVTHPLWYDSGAVTPTSFRFGGPGAC